MVYGKIILFWFYFLRSSLSIKGVGLFRWERDVFYLGYDKDEFQKMDGMHRSDHKGVIFLQQKYYSNSDKLLQSEVNGKMPYYWLMDQREYVNYKHKTFCEPNSPFFWSKIEEILAEKDLNYLLNVYLEDSSLSYCFDPEHSVLATPIQRFKQTCIEFGLSGMSNYLEPDKIDAVNSQINLNYKFERIPQMLNMTT